MRKLFKTGEIYLWFTGAVLGLIILMVAGLLFIVSLNGVGVFWPSNLAEVKYSDGRVLLGEIKEEEEIPQSALPEKYRDETQKRFQMKIGNRDVYGSDFRWVSTYELNELYYPDDAICIERREFGNLYGRLAGIKDNGVFIAQGGSAITTFKTLLDKSNEVFDRKYQLEKNEIGKINYDIEQQRLRIKKLKFYGQDDPVTVLSIEKTIADLENKYKVLQGEVDELNVKTSSLSVVVTLADGSQKEIELSKAIRFYQPNGMNVFEKTKYYSVKVHEFLFDDPRESNTEGGVFPAIFGTVMMVLLMTVFVVPFGVMAALYLREYAKQGLMVRLTRIAVNNLAGVPSIVFGIFGLGFFVYACGGTIDALFYPDRLPTPTWGTGGILWASLTLSLLTVPVVIVATEEALAAVPRGARDASLALGATKWQTTWRVVLPASTPGILTGVILAMARGAGEVAPLMITGVVKLAPNLPLDTSFPFFHLDRKFMHLGFHIYDVGFQSPNVEAAKPMVFMTALLLILIVLMLNLTAIIIRARLRKKYKGSAF
ncbi:phosphate ABC transporter permease PstA [bacterium]|nr:phosphate ABC transporter permease PstA [bacterium]